MTSSRNEPDVCHLWVSVKLEVLTDLPMQPQLPFPAKRVKMEVRKPRQKLELDVVLARGYGICGSRAPDLCETSAREPI